LTEEGVDFFELARLLWKTMALTHAAAIPIDEAIATDASRKASG
jgi:hypothetical protein